MHIRRRRGWEVAESQATPEHVFFNRRAFLSAGTAALAAFPATPALAQRVDDDPSMALYPVKRNETYKIDRDLTDEKSASNYNNFYEFGLTKGIARAAQALQTRPWTIAIDGMVEKPMEVGIDDLLKAMPLEERVYRMRCVEAWGMTVPWSGFAMKAFLDYAKPLSGAKFVRMETFLDPKMAPGQRAPGYPWPYVEGLTIEEAANELTMLVTGVYGKPAAKQFGAPIRLIVPWKYGFKGVKSIRRITFTDKRPVGLWEALQPSEDVLGKGNRVPTLIWNGYGEFVAGLYAGKEKERLFA